MKLENERHTGKCDHCHTEVPVLADVCTGCGARWGFRNGNNRQQQYDAFKLQYNVGRVVFFLSVIFWIFVYFYEDRNIVLGQNSLYYYFSGVVGFLGGLSWFLRGSNQIEIAKKGKLQWYRRF